METKTETKGLTVGQMISMDGTTFTVRAIKPNRFTGETCVHIVDEGGGRIVVSPSEIAEAGRKAVSR